METNFLKRYKCPDNFTLIARSKNVSNVRRGGVAVYMKDHQDLEFTVYHDVCPDAVVFSIRGTRLLIVAPYVTPYNSKYRTTGVFSILSVILSRFKNYEICMIGDLNARCGTPVLRDTVYETNPDSTVNDYGKKLINLCNENDLVIINGLKKHHGNFDTKFTFHRGNAKSQNDWCVSNCSESIDSFSILPKLLESDHSPLSVKLSTKRFMTLELLESMSAANLSYEMYEKMRVKPKICIDNMDTTDLAQKFNSIAHSLQNMMDSGQATVDVISNALNSKIYNACAQKSNRLVRIPEQKEHLTSYNFRAIADANLHMYNISLHRLDPAENSMQFFDAWVANHEYALLKEKTEYNEKVNPSWKKIAKDDPKKLWKKINYKDENNKKRKSEKIDEKTIQKYFKGIFQAPKLEGTPTVADVRESLAAYNVYVPILDDDFTLDELNVAIEGNGQGIGLDGMDKKIANLFTLDLRKCILRFFNQVFSSQYPDVWTKLALRPEEKKGHSPTTPKLRGVAISQLLPTLYDIMMNNRFNLWYVKNAEQAGFTSKQGCIMQVFALYLLMEAMKAIGKSLFIGFLDYEKAFDFINRCNIIKHLMDCGAGSRFITAIANMYEETSYVPRVGNFIGDAIVAKHGVTQGRQSSTSLFSFEVKELPESVNEPQSCLNGFNALQLADDTALPAESIEIQVKLFKRCFGFSKKNFMFANVDKTVYLHLDDRPYREPLKIDDDTTINAAKNDEYPYLGVLVIASNNIIEHIKHNLKHRAYHEHKYFDWLAVNEGTPIRFKIQVLYTCMFMAYLYGAEAWWAINKVSEQILKIERKLLKAVLGVKSNTPDDILYREIDRPDIIASINQRQYSFYHRLLELDVSESVCKKIVLLCQHLPICQHYMQLDKDICSKNKSERNERMSAAKSTYVSTYNRLVNPKLNHIIYDSCLHENLRLIITKWRTSNHRLRIETARRERPKPPKCDRLCSHCGVIEDEEHAIFHCSLYRLLRMNESYAKLLRTYPTINDVLNPRTVDDAVNLGNYLREIERRRKELNLEHLEF